MRPLPGAVDEMLLKRKGVHYAHLASALSTDQALLLSDALAPMMGVQKVLAEWDRVERAYDLLQVHAGRKASCIETPEVLNSMKTCQEK